jgi:hypothetical protein
VDWGNVRKVTLFDQPLEQLGRLVVTASYVALYKPVHSGTIRLALLSNDPMQLGMRRRKVDELANEELRDGELVNPSETFGPRIQSQFKFVEYAIDGSKPELVFVAEVIVQQRLGDPGASCDFAGCGAVIRQL